MAVTQDFVDASTPMGANLRPDGRGVTFRVWAPRAEEVFLVGDFDDGPAWRPDPRNRLVRDQRGYWMGFKAEVRDGDPYKFWVVGAGSAGFKRDPYARELASDPPYPHSNCVVRRADGYAWRAAAWRSPDFADLALYQLHVGTFHGPERRRRVGTFLDVTTQLPYLSDLGVTGLQLLPIVEFASPRSLGYDGSDLFSPEMDYTLEGDEALAYLPPLNELFRRLDQRPLTAAEIQVPVNQLKILVDAAHLHGLAVLLDVVYNHAGLQVREMDEGLYFFDRAPGEDPNQSLYFTNRDHTGPVFAFWREEVRQFLIDNATFFLTEYRVDGLRYDQTSVIDLENRGAGWQFLQAVTGTTRAARPETIQVAEYWPRNPHVTRTPPEGAGFHATWNDGLREALRAAVAQAAGGAGATVDLEAIAREILAPGFAEQWQVVNYVESHDEVYVGREPRLARIAGGADARSWYARSRSRAATCLLLSSPGIPMLFMGQEILEDKPWSDNAEFFGDLLIYWDGLHHGDQAMVDMHRCCREMLALRRRHPALRRGACRVCHLDPGGRILALHRWLEGEGEDMLVVLSLAEQTQYGYRIGVPRGGAWREVFNSDVYDHWVNPWVAGNGGGVAAVHTPSSGFAWSAELVLPANSVLVLAPMG